MSAPLTPEQQTVLAAAAAVRAAAPPLTAHELAAQAITHNQIVAHYNGLSAAAKGPIGSFICVYADPNNPPNYISTHNHLGDENEIRFWMRDNVQFQRYITCVGSEVKFATRKKKKKNGVWHLPTDAV